ncbi:MAG: hypothetical protein IT388_01015 [Nitrospirales bacterium]|nr:hypothetical protein [Nitrospirales bacterium]
MESRGWQGGGHGASGEHCRARHHERPLPPPGGEAGIPKQELLFCLSEYYGCPFVEYDEGIILSREALRRVDGERLKAALWAPLSLRDGKAKVIACDPGNPSVTEDVRNALGVQEIEFLVALPSDLARIIENNQDINPQFPLTAGRTPLAKVRNFLAEQRSRFACRRTALAKGRTGLAFVRTGLSFITIALSLIRFFSGGIFLTSLAALFLAAGIVMAADGLLWYLPARNASGKRTDFVLTEATCGTTILEVARPGNDPVFMRSTVVKGADALRAGWASLSPVMRRRFLASDRTDMAEERTALAWYRTLMAEARTGLAFARSGIAFAGLGIGLLRQFQSGSWMAFDIALIGTGCLMAVEGFFWYLPGRRAGRRGLEAIGAIEKAPRIWDAVLPFAGKGDPSGKRCAPRPPVSAFHSPGVWATTGLALERTVLAERRNVMARLRTVMARSRTGMALIRTGMSIAAVGIGLQVFFGVSSLYWTVLNGTLILAGLLFTADGLSWHLPAERVRKQYPYCSHDMEMSIPDYGIPASDWERVVFHGEEE